MVEPLILIVFIKIKHHFVKINLKSSKESYQLITFANRHTLAKTLPKITLHNAHQWNG